MGDAADRSLGGETAKGTAAKAAMAVVGFAGTVVLARLFDPAVFGGFYLLLSLVKLVDRPVRGFGTAAKKRFSEVGSRRSEVLGGQFLVTGLWVAFAGLGALLLGDWLRSYTGLRDAPVLFVVLLAALGLYVSFERAVEARGLLGVSFTADAVRSYLTLPLQVGFIFLGFGAAGMAWGLAAATFLSIPLLVRYVDAKPAVPSRETVESLLTYARYSIPGVVIGKAYDRFDVLLLGFLVGQSAAGNYEVAAKLTIPALIVAEVAGSGLMARASNLHSEGRAVGLDVTNTLAFASILAVPIFFGAVALAEPLVVTVYGPAYAEAGTLLVAIALYRLVRTQNEPLLQTLDGLDRPDVTMRLSVAALAVNIAFGVALTLAVGPVGVALSTVLAECVRYGWAARVVRRETAGVELLTRPFLEQVATGLVMFLVVAGLHRVVPVRSWLHLGLLVGVGAVTYGATLFAISSQLRYTVGTVLRGSRIEHLVPSRLLTE
ncbi:oligosaccharide flippase family protein [Halorussus sp. AFM4]|uniref:oligosaccharide flippase family protein n=1 Tax=Halorussus sp. AFM4 TaxID=3421651 RepID=UPI003EB7802E